jgi:hypothetical protein
VLPWLAEEKEDGPRPRVAAVTARLAKDDNTRRPPPRPREAGLTTWLSEDSEGLRAPRPARLCRLGALIGVRFACRSSAILICSSWDGEPAMLLLDLVRQVHVLQTEPLRKRFTMSRCL